MPMINSKMNGFHVPFLAFDQGLTPNRVVRHRRALGHRWGPAGAPDIGNDETGPWISVGKNGGDSRMKKSAISEGDLNI